MPLTDREITDDLAQRKVDSHRILDRWGSQRIYYRDWQDDIEEVERIYRGEFTMVWPDGKSERVDPAIPNLVRLSAEDRARDVAANAPSVVCHPEGPGDEPRAKADKLERVVSGILNLNRIKGHTTQM